MTRNWLGAAALSISITGAAMAEPTFTLLSFDDLDDWAADDHQAALTVFTETCGDLKDPEWDGICAVAKTAPDARAFFEAFFQPVLIQDGAPMLFTGYFEPELRGAPTQGGEYQYPIYRLPDDHVAGEPYLTRQEIEDGRPLAGRGLRLRGWLILLICSFCRFKGRAAFVTPTVAASVLAMAARTGMNIRPLVAS